MFKTLGLCAAVLLAACHGSPKWHLDNVAHIVAPLKFSLQSSAGGTVTAANFRGKVTLLYFGYTHCPDVCPTTLAKLAGVLRQLGPAADGVRVLFVTVDPVRDTLPMLRTYVDAFDARHFVGLRGDAHATAGIARRYRIGYTLGKPDAAGNYAVSHSSAVFIFDRNGDARLLGTETTPSADFVDDLRRLLRTS
ncbi:MAG: SCO family protein [Gammaproteobacteria bacterium]|nr:SCO family protein [Gammaproteobacteria bacterium]